MDIQDSIKLGMSSTPESWKKRLIAQPLNGSSTIQIGTSSSTQTRIEIPSCCNYIGDLEIGYQMALSNSAASTNMPFLPASFLPEIQRLELFFGDATSKLIDLQNFNVYSRMTTPLFNDYKKRTISERVCFMKEKSTQKLSRNFIGENTLVNQPYMFNPPGSIYTTAANVVATSRENTAAGTFSIAAQTDFIVQFLSGPKKGTIGILTINNANPAVVINNTLAIGDSANIYGSPYVITSNGGAAAFVSPTWGNGTTVNFPIYTLTNSTSTQNVYTASQQAYTITNPAQGFSQAGSSSGYVNNLSVTDSATSDAYFSDSIARTIPTSALIPPTQFNQQEYLPMGYFSTSAQNNATTTFYPVQYNFNFKLKDVIHDSVLSNLKCIYHRSNLVLVIYWQPVSQILFEVPTAVTANAYGIMGNSPSKNGSPVSYPSAAFANVNLNISNLFVRYYSETNPVICEQIKNATYELSYPFLYQSNLSLEPGTNSGAQIGVNLIIGNELPSRLYRCYTALQGTKGSFLNADNFGNIQYKKWTNLMELYFNNDLYERLTAAYGDWDAGMACFKDGSINSSVELQNLGTIAWHFDTDTKNGRASEYDDNCLKGKLADSFMNLNPRFIGIGSDGDTNSSGSYTQYVFAVIMRKCIIDKGEMKLV